VSAGAEVGRVIPNAPSEVPRRQRLFHTPPPWIGSRAVYFITLCCAKRRTNQLARTEPFSVIAEAMQHYMTAEKLWAHLVLAMPDHVHALISFPRQEQMAGVIRNWKRFVAKQAGITWQDGFFDHRLRDHENFEQKAHYIRMNPVRAGLISQPEKWAFVWPAHVSEPAR
jgi:putative transposase